MKKRIQILLCLGAALLCWSCNPVKEGKGLTYFVSSEGNDQNTGLSEKQAWLTLDRVNEHAFSAGDTLYFRSGEEFAGTLTLGSEDSGTPEKLLHINSYGEGVAKINGLEGRAFYADSCDFFTLENLELFGKGRKSGNTSDGILVMNCRGVSLNELEVYGFQHSGIHLHQCNDALITYVYAHENGFAGIHVSGTTIWDTAKYDNHNLYIGYCVAENNPGDPSALNNHSGNGILASSVKSGTIEYCEAFNNGWDMPWTENGPVGIWIWDCTDFIIQHCISHHNRTNPVADDGGGFDLDGGVSNSVIQYCISHNNEGAGFGLYEFGAVKPWENNTIRYNISQDDGIISGASLGIWKSEGQGIIRNCQIYNNTFYNSQKNGSSIWLYDNYPGFYFYNNVFVYNGFLLSEGNRLKDEIFLGNLYWNLAGEESFFEFENLSDWASASGKEMYEGKFMGLYQDPMLNLAGSMAVTDPSKINQESIGGYIPLSGSPLVDGGLDLKLMLNLDAGEKDLLGTPFPSKNIYDIGAIELDY